MSAPETSPKRAASDLAAIHFDGALGARRTPEREQERNSAVYDILRAGRFRAARGEATPPFVLRLAARADGLALALHLASPKGGDKGGATSVPDTPPETPPLAAAPLTLAPFRSLLRDYGLVCESYYEAIRTSSSARIESLDMARRSLHNEGGTLVQAQLEENFSLDDETARRFFSLLFALRPRALDAGR